MIDQGISRGAVRVLCSDGTEHVRQVLIAGDNADAWELWGREKRFELENTRFVDIGGTVYRSETISRIDPVRAAIEATGGQASALQVALAALVVIERGMPPDYAAAKRLANETRRGLEDAGFMVDLTEAADLSLD